MKGMNDIQYRIFIRFLKENKCYNELKTVNKHKDNNFSLYKFICLTREPIIYSFSWDNSIMGPEFWLKISLKWSDLILKILKREKNECI